MMFKGIILSDCQNIEIVKSSFVLGLFFVFIHLDMHQFLYTFIIGIIFAVFVLYTGSIFSSITAHFIINGTQEVLMYFLMKYSDTSYENTVLYFGEQIIAVGISAVVFGVLFILVFLYFIKSNKSIAIKETERQKIVTALFIGIIIIYIVFIISENIFF